MATSRTATDRPPNGRSPRQGALARWVETRRRDLPYYDDPSRPAWLNTAGMALRPRRVVERLAARAADPLAAATAGPACRGAVARLAGAPPEDCVAVMGAHPAAERLVSLAASLGGHWLVDPLAHEALLAPLRRLEALGLVRVVLLRTHEDGTLDRNALRASLTGETRAVVLTHVASVTGTIKPVRHLARMVDEHRRATGTATLLVVDGAQAAPRLPVAALGADAWIFAFQKVGALAGAAVVFSDLAFRVLSGREDPVEARAIVAHALAAGTPHAEAQGSFADAWEHIEGLAWPGEPPRTGMAAVHLVLHDLTDRLSAELATVPGLSLLGPSSGHENHNAGIVAFNLGGVPPGELGAELLRRGFVVRAGVPDRFGHCFCVPEAARALPDLAARGGAVRVSVGWHTHPAEIEALGEALRAIAAS